MKLGPVDALALIEVAPLLSRAEAREYEAQATPDNFTPDARPLRRMVHEALVQRIATPELS